VATDSLILSGLGTVVVPASTFTHLTNILDISTCGGGTATIVSGTLELGPDNEDAYSVSQGKIPTIDFAGPNATLQTDAYLLRIHRGIT
jgi:hypothetical protein